MKKEALYYEKLNDSDVKCLLCPHQCLIKSGKSGFCRVRYNSRGVLEATTYGLVSAAGMDPIEKKPLYHFYPGSMILSLGQAGCSFHCDFCQNYHMLNPADIPLKELSPEDAVKMADQRRSDAIAYTYNEPWVGYEYVLDTAETAHAEGLKNVLVTNGYYMQEPFENLAPFIDAMNIDLKSIRDDFYKTVSHGELAPVKRTIERALDSGIHIELTNLLITNCNDSPDDIRKLVEYIAGLDPKIPLHLSRYHPAYKMTAPPTPQSTLSTAYRIASDALNYVYLGNVAGREGTDTFCPKCDALLVSRSGFSARRHSLDAGKCTECGERVNFVME